MKHIRVETRTPDKESTSNQLVLSYFYSSSINIRFETFSRIFHTFRQFFYKLLIFGLKSELQ
jgi:hypothetical protein